MAYFPNGTAGMLFNETCFDCIHGISDDIGCPIALAQMMFYYEHVGIKPLEDCMNLLVNEHGVCKMKPILDKYYTLKPDEEVEVSTQGIVYKAHEFKPINQRSEP